MLLLRTTSQIRDNYIRHDVPWVIALAEIRYSAGLAHLWLEELLTGDPSIDVADQVLEELERALFLGQALLEGGRIDRVWTIERPVAEPEMRLETERLTVLLESFRELTLQRLEQAEVAGVGTVLDIEYDSAFRLLLDQARTVQQLTDDQMLSSQRRARLLTNGILVLWTALVILAVVGLLQRDRRRRHAELLLRRSEERLRTTLESIGDAVITTDDRGRVKFLNSVAQRITGWAPQQALSQHLDKVLCRPSDSAERQPSIFDRAISNDGLLAANEETLERRDGERVPIERTVAPLLSEDGQRTGLVIAFRDISQRKQAAAELRESEEQLRQSQKLEAVGRLAGGIAHDINNYLAAITVESDLLRMRHEEEASVTDPLDVILESALKASSLIKRLLAFSRPQVSKVEVIDLNVVIEGMQTMLGRLIGEDIRFQVDLEAGLWNVEIDPAHLEQILVNLLVNARDAMPQGGSVRVATRNVDAAAARILVRRTAVDPGEEAADGCVLLTVADTGCGIPSELRDKVLEPFFTTKSESGSSGLGLSTVYGIVREASGSLSIESAEGEGTTFSILLPRSGAQMTVARVRSLEDAGKIEPARILLVEDNDDFRQATVAYLEAVGHEVTTAKEPREALDLVNRAVETFDLVITDFLMPGMTGRDLVEELWSLGHGDRVLFISGHADESAVASLLEKEGVEFLAKPFAGAALIAKIEGLRRSPPTAESA